MDATFTIYFEDPFWVGLLESEDEGTLVVARHVFGAEPSNAQLLHFMLYEFHRMRRSPPAKGSSPAAGAGAGIRSAPSARRGGIRSGLPRPRPRLPCRPPSRRARRSARSMPARSAAPTMSAASSSAPRRGRSATRGISRRPLGEGARARGGHSRRELRRDRAFEPQAFPSGQGELDGARVKAKTTWALSG